MMYTGERIVGAVQGNLATLQNMQPPGQGQEGLLGF